MEGGLDRQGWSGKAEDRSRAKERGSAREDVRLERQGRRGREDERGMKGLERASKRG